MIKHHPQFDTAKVIKHYEQKDGVEISYVGTTDLSASDCPVDVFFRESPHPLHGNRYFGLFMGRQSRLMICNADQIEDLEFGMIEDTEGDLHYSQSHHDYKVVDGNMIDGGRTYIRSSGNVRLFKVVDGQFVEREYA